MPRIHPTALIDSAAQIGERVTVGAYTEICADAIVGDDSIVESSCLIGYDSPLASGPLSIGSGAHIRSHSVLYAGSTFAPGLVTGHHVTIREGVQAGRSLQVGTLSDLQGDTIIGDYVRTHSNVHIGKNTRIGSFIWIFPYVVLTNDPQPPSEGPYKGPVIEDFAVIATHSTVMPDVRIATHSLVAAHSLVREDVAPHTVVGGVPARKLGMTTDIKLRDGSGRQAYPWTTRFHRGYPEEIVRAWLDEFDNPA